MNRPPRQIRSTPAPASPEQNHILNALPAAERERLFPHLKLVELSLGMVLYESGDPLRHIYFPTDSIVSLLYVLADGSSAEISVVGERHPLLRASYAVAPAISVR